MQRAAITFSCEINPINPNYPIGDRRMTIGIFAHRYVHRNFNQLSPRTHLPPQLAYSTRRADICLLRGGASWRRIARRQPLGSVSVDSRFPHSSSSVKSTSRRQKGRFEFRPRGIADDTRRQSGKARDVTSRERQVAPRRRFLLFIPRNCGTRFSHGEIRRAPIEQAPTGGGNRI